ncbi:MAG: type II secretion system F family protein [Candidatus Omnitrophica bacterium]|nr:type II secretion system F family protein [Candidatus Omnitrophota bacterium]
MQTFTYKARDEQGNLVRGKMEADSEGDLFGKLRERSFMPVRIEEAAGRIVKESAGERFQKVRAQEIILFSVQLAGMIDAGVTLLHSLNIIVKQTGNKNFKEIIKDIIQSVAAGSTFSDALNAHPGVFSKLYVGIVRSGEKGGSLNVALSRLAFYLEKQEDLRRKIQEALFYPSILFVSGLAVIVIIMTFVMPKFIEIFDRANVVMPLPTLILQKIGIGMQKFWYIFMAAALGVVVGVKAYISTNVGRLQVDRVILKVPVVGMLVRKIIVSRFCRTLATLVENGVPMLQSLDLMRDVVGNVVIANVVRDVRDNVEKGERLAKHLEASQEFPLDAVQIIAVGEETGKLSAMLNKVADFYDTTTGYSIKKLTTLIEPIFIVLMGGVVGFIMASLLLPLFDMVKTIRG